MIRTHAGDVMKPRQECLAEVRSLTDRKGIHCSEGNVLLAGRKPTIERRGEELNLEGGTELGASGQLAPVQGHNQHVRDLIQAIDDDREPEIPGWSARTAVDVALALYQASDSRSVVRLPQG